MKDDEQSKGQLIDELAQLRQRIAGLEKSESERKRAEEALRESEGKYRSFFEISSDCVFISSQDGRLIDMNDAGVELFGYESRDKILNVRVPDLYANPEDRKRFIQLMEQQGFTKDFAADLRRKDGSIINTLITSTARKDEDGNVIDFHGAIRDVTEQKRAEERIEHLNAVLRAIRNVNQLITREKDTEKLLKRSCEILIETRGYHNAWVALMNESGSVATVAEAGLGEDFTPMRERLMRGELPECCQKALKRSGVVIIEDPRAVCADCPLSSTCKDERGTMTIRLDYGGKSYGFISVAILRALVTDREEQKLFEEVAEDVAFALHSIETGEARTQAEEELRRTHRQLADIIEFLPDATFVIDADKKVIAWNRAIEAMTGVRKEEVIGKGDYAYAVPFYGDARPILIDLTFLSDEEIESRYDYIKKEGDTLVAEIFIPSVYGGKGAFLWGSASRLYDPEGNVVGAIESIRDISTLKRAEKALSEEKERLEVTLRSIGDGVIVTDTKGTVTALNPVAEDLTGWRDEEAAGRPLNDVFHIINEKTREVCENPVEKVMENGLVVGLANHTALIARDGTERVIADSGAPIKDKDENIIGVVLVFRDVTEEKRAEDALRETRDHLENLIGYANAPIIVWDPDSKISRFNHAFEHLTGYTASEVIGQELKMLFPEASRDESLNKIARTLSGEYWESVGIPIVRKDGDVRIALWNSANIYAEDGKTLLATIAQGQDITERKKAEEERERVFRELEAKTRELEQIVYVTSHDLRSPLVNVQGFSKELAQSIKELSAALQSADIPAAVKDEVSPILDEDVPEALRYIHTSTAKMDLLLSGLLRLSRLGRVALTIEKQDMNELMSEIASAFEFQLKEKSAELVVDTLPPCKGDKMQVNQVFSNLLDNALKYLDPNRQGVIKISGRVEDEQSIYCVEDNGVGIAPEHQAKIFEIFHQLEPGTGVGEGLGLTIVRRILDRHNGNIWLESEPGKGSKFFVALPTDKPRKK